MKPNWTDRELSDRLRRLSAVPPNVAFEQRLSLSLGLAAQEIRASRLPTVDTAQSGKRTYMRAALCLGLGIAVAAGVSRVWFGL